MREKIKKFSKSRQILTQKGIERFNESCFKSRKVKRRATSSENRKFFVAVVKSALGVVKKMLINGGFVKLLWACVGLARAGKALAVRRGRRIGNGSKNVSMDLGFFHLCKRSQKIYLFSFLCLSIVLLIFPVSSPMFRSLKP